MVTWCRLKMHPRPIPKCHNVFQWKRQHWRNASVAVDAQCGLSLPGFIAILGPTKFKKLQLGYSVVDNVLKFKESIDGVN